MRQLIIIALIVLVYLVIKRAIRGAVTPRHQHPDAGGHAHANNCKTGPPGAEEEMVRDPNCNTFIPVSRSITVRQGSELLHFCSEECARQYAQKNKG